MMENPQWLLNLMGRLHPLLVHFPIGLLVTALFLEAFTIRGKHQGLRDGINWMIFIGAISASFTAIFGWLLRTQEEYSGNLVDNHQYAGIATAGLAVATALVLRNNIQKKSSDLWLYRSLLAATVILLTIAGHLGASLTHGENYLTDVLPGNKNAINEGKSAALLSEMMASDSLSAMQKDKLNLEVRGIFAHKCYQCHSENKQKGKLILENKKGVFKGGKSGAVIVPYNPEQSELFRRISLSSNDEDVMPSKGKLLSTSEIKLVKLWIQQGAYWSNKSVKIFPEAKLGLIKPELPDAPHLIHPVDKFIGSYFDQHNLDWPEVVNDRTFIRRAYMDIIGLLPEPEAVSRFEKENNQNKRELLIDSLLNDRHNYSQHWLSFWNDLLRNDYSGTGFITRGRKQITGWLYNSLKDNKPYNQMVKELVNPEKGSEGFIEGIKWRGLVNASQRTEMQAAQNIGQSLMGVNVKCASCHNSFVSNLTLAQAYGFATIFSDSVLELNRCDIPMGKKAKVNFLYPELGSVDAETVEQRLLKLSNVMVKKENGRLYRTMSNRYWTELMGRGIVESVDEMDNPPWDPALLDWLAADFIDSGSDLKQFIKRIMTSKAYQLPTVSYEKEEEIKADYIFQGPILRRMSAEQFSDAVSQVISPLYPAVEFNPNGDKTSAQRIWHKELSFNRAVLPKPGKRYFRKAFKLTKNEISNAKILISVDHSYIIYINGIKVSVGNDWRKVDKVDVIDYLKSGENIIALQGENEGSIENPAGILFSMKVQYKSGDEFRLDSDISWLSTDKKPDVSWITKDFNESSWQAVKNYGTQNWGMLLNFSFDNENTEFARASLVKQHPFMKALGRPSREIVTTSREEQATLLQALELTNGAFFNGVLAEGAEDWLEKYGTNSEKIVDELYQKLFGRNPTTDERKIMMKVLGRDPRKEQVEDLFWSVLLLPEFQFIY